MQNLMVKSGSRYRKATEAEVADVAGFYALQAMNKARPSLQNPADAVSYLCGVYTGRGYETFAVLFLDTRHQLIECVEMFRGTIDGSSVHPREVVKEALWKSAAAVIFSHNHPSGIAQPSQADQLITTRLQNALALIDVRVLDHLIIGGNGSSYSFAQNGLI